MSMDVVDDQAAVWAKAVNDIPYLTNFFTVHVKKLAVQAISIRWRDMSRYLREGLLLAHW